MPVASFCHYCFSFVLWEATFIWKIIFHILLQEKMKGKNKLVPRLLGVTKDSVMRVDEKTKEVLQEWPLTTVKRWAASPKSFTLVIFLCIFRA